MALSHYFDYSKLLLSILCTLLLFNSIRVDGAIENDIYTSRELQRRVRSSFYVLGYCSSYVDSGCKSLISLLESSEQQARDGLFKTGLVVFDAAYWQPHVLTTSSAVTLWFACHDGRQIRVKPIDAAGLNVLVDKLAAAAQQQGAVCIDGQVQHMKPGAAAAAAEPDATLEAFLQGLDMSAMDTKSNRWRNKIVGFNIATVVTAVFLAAHLHLSKQPKLKSQPGTDSKGTCEGFFEAVTAMCTALPAAIAINLGIEMLLQLWGFDGSIFWLWGLIIFLIVFIGLAAIGDILHQNASAADPKSSAAGDMECTPINTSSETATSGLSSGGSPVTGAPKAPTATVKSPAAKPSADMLV